MQSRNLYAVEAATSAREARPTNGLLAAVPREEFARLEPALQHVVFAPKQLILARDNSIEHVYFPSDGVFSLTTPLADGTLVESATVGREGMLGVEAFCAGGPIVASADTILQVPDGAALRMPIAIFRAQLEACANFERIVGRYAQALLIHVMQSTACNARHDAVQRCCRWLLTTADRIGRQQFSLSQEFLAAMIAVRRPTVTVVARQLQHDGLIRYSRGRMEIVDRDRLESMACECYGVVRAAYARIE